MSERLRPRDLAFLAEESPSTPRHNATVEIFDPGDSGFDYARLVELIGDRISFVPRYRQRIAGRARAGSPTRSGSTTTDFDLGYHVRRSALPRPGSPTSCVELVARIVSRPLDRHRPLWEIYFVEGLEDGRVALLSKSHQVLVDGVDTVDLGQVLLDRTPEPRPLQPRRLAAAPAPSSDRAGRRRGPGRGDRPGQRRSTRSARRLDSALRTRGRGRLAGRAGRRRADQPAARRRPPDGRARSRSNAGWSPSAPRSPTTARSARRTAAPINDVILATVTGALRGWLMARSESMSGLRQVRAVVPVSVIDGELEATSLGSQIVAHFVDLPVGEASPVVRLHQVSYSFQAHKETGRGVAANRLAGIAGFAPSTFHAIGARVAADEIRRGFQLSVTNVPGPQSPLYAAGARMVETYPVPRCCPDTPLAIGVTSYDGQRLLRHHRRPRPGPRRRRARPVRARGARRAARHDRRPRSRTARAARQEDEQADDSSGPLMRVYQPTTLAELAAAYAAGSVQPDADAVVSDSESEDDEYAALMTAADLSAARIAGLADGLRRRVVVVARGGLTTPDRGRARRSRRRRRRRRRPRLVREPGDGLAPERDRLTTSRAWTPSPSRPSRSTSPT